MAAAPEARLLTRVLDGDLEGLLKVGFDPSIMIYPYDQVLDRAVGYFRKYGSIPSKARLATMCSDLGTIPLATPEECDENVLVYWDQIREMALRQDLQNALDELATDYNEKKMPPMSFVQHVISTMAKLDANRAYGGGITTLGDMADPLWGDYQNAEKKEIAGIPIPDEFLYLQASLGKLEPGHITTIVARRSVGKTWKGLILTLCGAMTGHSTLIASMEMPRLDLSRRLVALAAGLDFNAVKKGELLKEDRMKYEKFLQDMAKGKGFWDNIAIMEPREIKSVFAVENRAHSVGAELVFADAFYLYPGRGEDERYKRIENNLSDVRAVSLDTLRHWILTAQFNRRAKGAKTSDEFAIGGSDSFNQDSNNIIHLIQTKKEKKNRTIIFELGKGRDCDVQFPWVHHWNFLTMQRGPIGLYTRGEAQSVIAAANSKDL
jgi:replicative DNA helicase